MIGIQCHQVPIETYSTISKIERYHTPLHRAYNIISVELGASVDKGAHACFAHAIRAAGDNDGLAFELAGVYWECVVDWTGVFIAWERHAGRFA